MGKETAIAFFFMDVLGRRLRRATQQKTVLFSISAGYGWTESLAKELNQVSILNIWKHGLNRTVF